MIKERVIQVIEYKGIAKEFFYKKIGMTSASFRGKAKETPLNSNAIENILSEIPDLNAYWLLTGNGKMLVNDPEIQELNSFKIPEKRIDHQEIPLYNLEATAGLQELFSSNTPAEILDTIKIPNLPRCDGAITITGDSMYPLLKSGDMVLYAKTSVENIFYGEMYLIGIKLNDLDEFVTVKYIQKSDIKDHITLVSQNTDHSSKDIPISSVIAIAIVKASIRINTMF